MPEPNLIVSQFVKLQGEVKALTKSKVNPHFKSKYVPLDDVIEMMQPLLLKYGFAFIVQPTVLGAEESAAGIRVDVYHESSINPFLSSLFPLGNLDPQKVGAAITYYRRYFMGSIFNIATEDDDDGNIASGDRDSGSRRSVGGGAKSAGSKRSEPKAAPSGTETPAAGTYGGPSDNPTIPTPREAPVADPQYADTSDDELRLLFRDKANKPEVIESARNEYRRRKAQKGG